MREQLPEFFIAGVPKSGTTALYDCMRQHPQVFMPYDDKGPGRIPGLNYKEPTFFAPDLMNREWVRDEALYLSLFREAPPGAVIGEASVTYSYSEEAAGRIRERIPHAKIILILRDPVDMMRALHGHSLRHLAETERDFARALDLEGPRTRGEVPLPPMAALTQLRYRKMARYGEQVERWLQHFPREQILWFPYERWRSDPTGIYREVCTFIGVDPEVPPVLVRSNVSRRPRSLLAQRVLFYRPRTLQRALRAILPKSVRHGIASALLGLNETIVRREPMDPALEARLRAEMADDVRLFIRLTGLPVEHWLPKDPAPQSTSNT